MTPSFQRQWLVVDRPIGRGLRESDFQLHEAPVTLPSEGQVLLKTLYLSFDPAQKGWMENASGYNDPVELGSVMPGSGVGVVLASGSSDFIPGDIVSGSPGWREFPTICVRKVQKVAEGVAPTAALSVLGTTGRTAYFGLMNVGKPKAGDTLVISGAAGATGSLVGQIGKLSGCRVIGIAGGPEKCAVLTGELGFDAAIDYKNEKVRSRLRTLCPDGIDIFFDNVGGSILDDALSRLSRGARVVICGGISRYNFDARSPSMPSGPRNYFNVVFTGATIQGFLLHSFERDFSIADARLTSWLRRGCIEPRADIQHGFENAPMTLARLFNGLNIGKQLLKVAEI